MSRRLARRPALRRTLLAGGLLGGLAAGGCTLLPATSRSYYELRDLAAQPPAAPQTRRDRPGRVLLVAVHPSSALYESSGIVYSRGDAGHSYYQYASWTERPSRRIALLAQRRLAGSAAAGRLALADAAMDTSGVRGDWLLGLRLLELRHDTATVPHSAAIVVEADLLDWNERRMLDRTVFGATESLSSEDAAGAVAALNRGLTAVLDRIEAWVAGHTGARPDPR